MDFLACLFFLFFLVFAYIIIADLVRNNRSRKTRIETAQETERIIENSLQTLDNNNVREHTKAVAFVALIQVSYVLIHKLVNEGNKYNDIVQYKHFSKNLTPQVIDSLFELEGKYE